MQRRGFTLIELLVVIVILSVLITLGSKGLRHARLQAKKAQAQTEMKSIETAVMAYYSKYGKLPSDAYAADRELSLDGTDNSDVISVLTAAAEDDPLNPADIAFLDAQSGSSTNFLDPWGYPYSIALDTDYDGRISVPGISELRRRTAAASIGLYQIMNRGDTNDYIFSWK